MPSTSIPYAASGVNVPGLAFITSLDMIQKNPALVRKMVSLLQKTIEAGRKDPEGAIDSLLKRAPTLKREVVLQVLTLSFRLLETEATRGRPLGWLAQETMVQAQDLLAQYGGIKTKLPIETYYTNEFVPGK